jgi:hypothetical protein
MDQVANEGQSSANSLRMDTSALTWGSGTTTTLADLERVAPSGTSYLATVNVDRNRELGLDSLLPDSTRCH